MTREHQGLFPDDLLSVPCSGTGGGTGWAALLLLLTHSSSVLQETDIQIAQESKRNSKKDSFLVVKDQVSLQMRSAAPGASVASERDADRTETEAEISEHLSGVSADFPGHKQDDDDDERTINSEYSDDFERSQCTADGEGASRASGQRSQSRRCSGEHASPPAPPPPPGEQRQVRRVTVREAAVQTLDLPFAYCWANSKFTRLCPCDRSSYGSFCCPVFVFWGSTRAPCTKADVALNCF